MVLTCSKCGRQIRDEDAFFCPFCSNAVKATASRRTDFPIAGGVLLLLAASICVLAGIVALAIFLSTYHYVYYYDWGARSYYAPRYWDLFAAAFGIVAFLQGLAAGILSLKRRKFAHCMVGGLLLILEGFAVVFAFAQQWPNSWILGILFGVPIIVLSVPALLFVSISKDEFE